MPIKKTTTLTPKPAVKKSSTKAPVKKPVVKKKPVIKKEEVIQPVLSQDNIVGTELSLAQKIQALPSTKKEDILEEKTIREMVQEKEEETKTNVILYNSYGEPIDLTGVKEPNPITGVGDVIKTVTTFFGIESCEDCEERREKLNRQFSFLRTVKRDLTDTECDYVMEVERTKKIEDNKYFAKLFNEIYGTNFKPCQCPGTYKDLLVKLVLQIKKQQIK